MYTFPHVSPQSLYASYCFHPAAYTSPFASERRPASARDAFYLFHFFYSFHLFHSFHSCSSHPGKSGVRSKLLLTDLLVSLHAYIIIISKFETGWQSRALCLGGQHNAFSWLFVTRDSPKPRQDSPCGPTEPSSSVSTHSDRKTYSA